MDKVIVTGSNGFIGYHLVNKLKELGKFVIGIDLKENNEYVDIYYSMDIINITEDIFEDVSTIYHLAGSAEPVICDNNPIDTINTYVSGTSRILELSNKYKCNVVVPSSIHLENYIGKPGDRNYSYLISKLTTDALCFYYKQLGTNVKVIRLSNVYGTGYTNTDSRVIPALVSKISNNEEIQILDVSRSFIDIDSVVDTLINSEDNTSLIAPEISIKDLVSKIQNVIKGKEFNENIIISKHWQ